MDSNACRECEEDLENALWASRLGRQAADEWEALYRKTLVERDEARDVARRLLMNEGACSSQQAQLLETYHWLNEGNSDGEGVDGAEDVG